jgi:hypothetical protein
MDCVLIKNTASEALSTRSFGELWERTQQIINYAKEKGVRCQQAQPVKVNRSGSQRESMGARGGSQEDP